MAPKEGLASGESEREGKVGRGEREQMPLFLCHNGPDSEGGGDGQSEWDRGGRRFRV